MKTKIIFSSLLIMLLMSCSSSDNPAPLEDTSPTNYFPLTNNNYWIYDVIASGVTTRDSLYVANDTVINAVVYKKLKTKDTPTGFFSTTLSNNGVKIDGKKLVMTGQFSFDFGLTDPINLGVTDFIFFQQGAVVGETLSSTSGTINQTVQTYPLTIDYTLKTVYDGFQSLFFTPNGDDYLNVVKTKVILNLKITTTQTISGIQVPITIMPAQDVIVSNQFYSQDIGMIYSNTLFNYQLNSIPNITLPIPSSGNQTQEEFLSLYFVN